MSVPGPFYRPPSPDDPKTGRAREGLSCLVKREGVEDAVLVLRHHLTEEECAELVSLLNKGTHFEAMREALEWALDILGEDSWGAIQPVKDKIRAALAQGGEGKG